MTLLHEINAYCAKHRICGSRLTRFAVNDPGYHGALRAGHVPTPRMAARLRKFMKEADPAKLTARRRDKPVVVKPTTRRIVVPAASEPIPPPVIDLARTATERASRELLRRQLAFGQHNLGEAAFRAACRDVGMAA